MSFDKVQQVDELKYIAQKLRKNFSLGGYSETLYAIAETIEAEVMHTHSPVEFGGDHCDCGHDIRHWSHTRY